jgi:hypothetical protein
MKVGDLVKVYVPNPYRAQIGIVIAVDETWEGRKVKVPMIEVMWSGGKIEKTWPGEEIKKVSTDDLLVINESR